MKPDIFEFWAQIKPSEHVHPADYAVMRRVGHGFDLDCLPGCFFGPLRTARIVLLFLSPGLSDQDPLDATSASSPDERSDIRGQPRRTRPRISLRSYGLPAHARFLFSFGSFAALRSAKLIRLCQPRPLRRKCASTSASSQRVTSGRVSELVRLRFTAPLFGFVVTPHPALSA